jgi:branched-chain amino acid transport system permease protein
MRAVFTRGIAPLYWLGGAALLAWPLLFNSSYDLRVFTLVGVYVILCLGFQFVFGHAGALALTQGSFFGLGAYVTGLAAIKLGWGFALTFPLAILVPLLLAAIIAVPVLKLESHYFSLATMGIGQVLLLIALVWEPMTGGANGMPGVPGVMFGETTIGRGAPLTAFVWALALLAMLLTWQLTRGMRGIAYTVMRENPLAATTLGIDIWRLRLGAFLFSAMFAGAAGALYVHTIRIVSPDALEFHIMVAVLTMVVVGGRTRVAGAVLGAFLLVHLPEWFRGLDKFYLIAYGAVLLAMVIAAPWGLVGALERARARFFPEPLPAPPVPLALTRRAAPKAGDAVLEARGIEMRFGGLKALDGVDFKVDAGEIHGLIGPNGSGKTTLVNVLTRIYTPQAGRLFLNGEEISRIAPHAVARAGVARTFQNLNLADELSALDNVAAARVTHGSSLTDARAIAYACLERMGAAEVAMRPCGGLAYGYKRRVEIARALALNPAILLLDEPAAGLNGSEQQDLSDRLRAEAASGLTLVVIEHNMPFLMPLATRMTCLDHGRVIAHGSPAEVRAHPEVIEAYLGSAQSTDGGANE